MTKEELEKEAEEYANNLVFVFETDIVQRIVRERVKLALIDVLEPREKRIAELEKENAELKDDNKVMADNYSKMEQKFYDNLTKAKEIIKNLMKFAEMDDREYEKEYKEAEQFLNSEVEK